MVTDGASSERADGPGAAADPRSAPAGPAAGEVSAVILTHNRRDLLARGLDRLATLPLAEIVVVTSGCTDGTADMVRGRGGNVRLLDQVDNVSIAGRNLGAAAARGEFLLVLDDDAYPLPGAVDRLLAAFRRSPRLGLVGGLVRDVELDGTVRHVDEPGTFDWFLRAGRKGDPPPTGFPAFFFPEGAHMVRRSAFLEVGGFFEPYYRDTAEIDLATRLLAAGWEVTYLPTAVFDHLKTPGGRIPGNTVRQFRVRNQIWYFWLRFPTGLAARRIPAYLLFDLIECARHGAVREWAAGIRAAWRGRAIVRPYRAPLPRPVLRRAELNRGRMHLRLLLVQVGIKGRALRRALGSPASDGARRLPVRRRFPYAAVRAVRRTIGRGPLAPVLDAAAESRTGRLVRQLAGRQMRAGDVLAAVAALQAADVPCWLAGGWGVDALLHRQTRRHCDVDLVVDGSQPDLAARVGAALAPLRLLPTAVQRSTLEPFSTCLVHADGAGRSVDVLPVDLTAEPFRSGRTTGQVAGQVVGCLTEQAQRALRAGYRRRAVDDRDLRLLARDRGAACS